jgi:hypothetical protein
MLWMLTTGCTTATGSCCNAVERSAASAICDCHELPLLGIGTSRQWPAPQPGIAKADRMPWLGECVGVESYNSLARWRSRLDGHNAGSGVGRGGTTCPRRRRSRERRANYQNTWRNSPQTTCLSLFPSTSSYRKSRCRFDPCLHADTMGRLHWLRSKDRSMRSDGVVPRVCLLPDARCRMLDTSLSRMGKATCR